MALFYCNYTATFEEEKTSKLSLFPKVPIGILATYILFSAKNLVYIKVALATIFVVGRIKNCTKKDVSKNGKIRDTII